MRPLVVDDGALVRQSFNLQLTRAGDEVHQAEDGRAAWDTIEREGYRFVITDWNMPGANGPESLSRSREAELPGFAYMMMLTDHTEKPGLVAGQRAGSDE